VRPALLWNDVRSAAAGRDLVAELGGPAAWAQADGSVPVSSFTVTKLRWLAEHEPELADQVVSVVLPHDWLTWRLRGRIGDLTTDRGDASGTGYWSPETGSYRMDLLARAFGRQLQVPDVLGPTATAGKTAGPLVRAGMVVAAGTGDNMGAALGLGAVAGDVVVSLGTSGTAFAVHDRPVADTTGVVAGFADATGVFLPLVATMNAARVLTATASLLGTDLAGLDALAQQAPAGAGGLVLLPYLDGERTPDRPDATGTLRGMTRASMTPAHLARAAVEGMLCGLADAVDALVRQGVTPQRVLLIGGAAQSTAVRAVAASLFGIPVLVPAPMEYVALGAARQAAGVLAGGLLPDWVLPTSVSEPGDPAAGSRVRAAYAIARERELA
ncbi:MAG: xylulose kinase, partial [Frankiales bacterium]|nr:xylulose kinase [Frankiales bacterium]